VRIVVAAACALVFASGVAAGTRQPSLRLVDDAPLTVAGQAFAPRTLVRLALRVGTARETRRVRSSAAGRFIVRFDAELGHACGRGPAVVVATLADGSRVGLKIPAPDCPPALSPAPAG
jgi:hypothetical protein